MLKQPIAKKWKVALVVASIVALLAAYTLVSYLQHVKNPNDTTIPTWRQLAAGVGRAFTARASGERWIVADSVATGARLFLGLFVGIVGAVVLGILMGCHQGVESFFVQEVAELVF